MFYKAYFGKYKNLYTLILRIYVMKDIMELLTRKGFEIITNIDNEKNVNKISLDSRITYNHCHEVVKKFIKQGLCAKKKKGRREFLIVLTEKGMKVKEQCIVLKGMIA